VNGHLQYAGKGSQARDVAYRHEGTSSYLSLDASPAYFPDPGSRRMTRHLNFSHDTAKIEISDEIDLGEPLTRFELPLYVSDRKIVVGTDGVCRLYGKHSVLVITPENLRVTGLEPIEITDPRHLDVWGNRVFKIGFEAIDIEKAIFGFSIEIG
jgi:hypothetical protein